MTDMHHLACLCGLGGLKLHGVVIAELLTVLEAESSGILEDQDLVRV